MKKITIIILTLIVITCILLYYILFSDKKISAKVIRIYDDFIIVGKVNKDFSETGNQLKLKLDNTKKYDKNILNVYNYVDITYSNITKEIKNIKPANIYEKIKIVAFLDYDITTDEINEVIKSIESLDNVEEIIFESKDEIKERLMASSSDTFQAVLSDMDGNPFQDTITVFVNSNFKAEFIAKSIKEIDNVEIVKY